MMSTPSSQSSQSHMGTNNIGHTGPNPGSMPGMPPNAMGMPNTALNAQIRDLVVNLNPHKPCFSELDQLLKRYGYEAYKYLFLALFDTIDFHGKLLNTPDANFQLQADQARVDLLKHILNFLLLETNFMGEVFTSYPHKKSELVRLIARKLNLSIINVADLALCLIQSQDQQVKQEGLDLIREDIINAALNTPSVEEALQRIFHALPKLNLFNNDREALRKDIQKSFHERSLNRGIPTNQGHLGMPGFPQHVGRLPPQNVQNTQLQSDMQLGSLFKDFGYIATANEEIVREIFKLYKKDLGDADITAQAFSCLLGEIASSHQGLKYSGDRLAQFLRQFGGANILGNAQDPGTWKLESLIPSLKEYSSHLDWSQIIEGLDYPDFTLPDKKSLAQLILIYEKVTGGAPFPIEKMIGRPWANRDAQLQFCLLALTFPPSTLNFSSEKLREINVGSSVKSTTPFHHIAWNSVEFIETLLNLAKDDKLDIVVKQFEKPIHESPDTLMIGVAQARPRHFLLQSELIVSYMHPKLSNPKLLEDKNAIAVLSQICLLNPEIFTRALSDIFIRDSSTLENIIDVLGELGVFELILASADPKFATHLAALSAFKHKNLLNFSIWLKTVLLLQGKSYIEAFVEYMTITLPRIDVTKKEGKEQLEYIGLMYKWIPLLNQNIKVEALQKTISSGPLPIPPQVWEELVKLQGKGTLSVSKEIESHADQHLKEIFNGTMTMENATALLKKLKESPNQNEKKLYACMIHNLFDEYRFFPKYTDGDLLKAACLFGNVINYDIIKGKTLELAKNFIFSSWISSDMRMVQFALAALNEFRGRLKEWPHFCSFIKHSYHDIKLYNEVALDIEAALKPSQGTKSKASPVLESSSKEETFSIYGVQKDDDTLVLHDGEEILTPSEEVQNNIGFIFNNLSQGKTDIFEERVKNLKETVDKKYYPYLCYYIVVERATTQIGHHDTYVQLVLSMKDKEFEKRIMYQTYKSINTLLLSPLKKENSLERKFLKTLGEWLGRLTLARNKPILVKELDLQKLLIQAFEKGNLPAIASFVSKTMTYCMASEAFRPPNPWTMMILSLMKEIHSHIDVDLSVRFDVEILTKELKLKLSDIPTRDPPFLSHLKNPYSSQTTGEREFDVSRLPEVMITLQSLSNDIVIPSLDIFNNNPGLKLYVVYALEGAIRDNSALIVKKSVGIACRTTYELVRKDFILDVDPTKFRRAAINMATWLTSKWLHITAKDLLFNSIYKLMKEYLEAAAIHKDKIMDKIDEAAKAVAESNVTLGCMLVDDNAREKAEQSILEYLREDIELRTKCIATGGQVPYTLAQDAQLYHMVSEVTDNVVQGYTNLVYESFAGAPRMVSGLDSHTSVNIPPRMDSHTPISAASRIPPVYSNVYPQPNPPVNARLTFEDAAEMINNYLSNIMTHAQKLKQDTRLSSLSPDTEIIKNLTLIPKLLRQCEDVFRISTFLADSMIQLTYQNRGQNPFMYDVYIYFLKASTQVIPDIVKQISAWWVKIDEIQKYGEVSLRFVLERILDYVTVDKDLSIAIENGNVSATHFALALIQHSQDFKVNNFADTIEALNRLSAQLPAESAALITKYYKDASSMRSPMVEYEASIRKRDVFVAKFDEWMEIYKKNPPVVKMELFVTESLQGSGLLTTDSDFVNLCKVLTKYAVDNFNMEHNKLLQQGISTHDVASTSLLFNYVDGYTKLVITILSMSNDESKYDLLNRALNITNQALFLDHEMNPETFNQRPYLRLFSNILIMINQSNDQNLAQNHLLLFAQKLFIIRPQLVPGFVFGWVDLLSHRFFMPKFLNQDDGYPLFFELLTSLLSFIKPHLEKQKLTDPIKFLYRATLRILLVLLHDFSEFLCEYSFRLCDEIAPNCIQMRNLVLSAFPRRMRLPDPSTPNLKVDLLPEIQESPNINVMEPNEKDNIKERFDNYLKNRNQLHDLIALLRLSTEQSLETGKRYNIGLINYLVLYIGTNAIEHHNLHGGDFPATDIFKRLILELDAEGRYHVLNAIANQLRYPNSHTYYFSRVLLELFAFAKLADDDELIQEQITRVVFERLIANRPHPWGLLVTFIELVRNRAYKIYDKQFIRCASEITNIFNNVKPAVDKDIPHQ